MKNVICDFCKKVFEPNESNECAWMNNVPTNWACDECTQISDSLYRQSDMMRDLHDSELSESYGGDI